MDVHKVAVLGGGSFGTVISNIIAENNFDVYFWMRSEEMTKQINEKRENTQYLPGYKLNKRVIATNDMETAVRDADIIFIAVPSHSFRAVVRLMRHFFPPETMLISATKGIEKGTFLLMSQIMQQEAPRSRVGVLSGPNLAKEIAKKVFTGTVIASEHASVRDTVKTILVSRYFRVYTNDDVFGIELGGSLKNIYAIVAGMAAALGMGFNTNSMLITRSLTEMARFGRELGADPMTFLGLAGVGDLIVTCSTPLSRNYRIGYALAQGKSLDEAAQEVGQVAEGVNTLKQVKEKAEELGVYMPLVTALYRVIFENQSIDNIILSLMEGEHALDVEFAAKDEKKLHHKE
ncbi:MAG: NAD(P)H-dependent glycerol-3-phosphate dehydrogenase [Gammaproteobacteria bacterium]|nr:NAD(P)H-dependent glycerol-3-phosphate dehydrogenase [Gammaproteobacteria bacterium]